MRAVIFSRLFIPHIGGVEIHANEIAKNLIKSNFKITVFTEKYDYTLPNEEIINSNLEIIRISYPNIKILGIIVVWIKLFRYMKYFLETKFIHIHDIFVWYLPLRILLFFKPVFVTFHGWEGTYPVPNMNVLQKQMSNILCNGSLAVGDYISKYYKISPTLTVYGAARISKHSLSTVTKSKILFLGRLDKDTGLLDFLKFLSSKKIQKRDIIFVGDGEYKELCKEYGKVIGFSNPSRYLRVAKIIVTSGYLSILEGMLFKTKVYVCINNKLKRDYYYLSPFREYINILDNNVTLSKFKDINPNKINKAFEFAKKYTWQSLYKEYLKLWNISSLK